MLTAIAPALPISWSMPDDMDKTRDLLQEWHAGDRAALDILLERDLGWIQHRVRERLGGELREKFETHDFVQEAMIDALQYGPKFVMSDLGEFRSLMARIIENNLRDKHGWLKARRRAREREAPLPADSALDLDMPQREVTRVTVEVQRRQQAELINLAMEFLGPEDRQVVYMRQWENKPFEEIGAAVGMKANTARMRFQRALLKLADKVQELTGGAFSTEIAPGE